MAPFTSLNLAFYCTQLQLEDIFSSTVNQNFAQYSMQNLWVSCRLFFITVLSVACGLLKNNLQILSFHHHFQLIDFPFNYTTSYHPSPHRYPALPVC